MDRYLTIKANEIKGAILRIKYYKKMEEYENCTIKKKTFQDLMIKEINSLLDLSQELSGHMGAINRQYHREEKVLTYKELAGYDGKNGKPAYVAVNGIVYDVSYEPTWGGASHFGLMAGKDLSAEFNGCHRAREILSRLKEVGKLQREVND